MFRLYDVTPLSRAEPDDPRSLSGDVAEGVTATLADLDFYAGDPTPEFGEAERDALESFRGVNSPGSSARESSAPGVVRRASDGVYFPYGEHRHMLTDTEAAPDFSLCGFYEGKTDTYRLSDLTDDGDWVLLTFYAFDFNPVCTAGMCSLRDTEFFQFEDGLRVLGVSGDGVYSHQRFAEDHQLNYPLLSDTSKEVGRKYGVVHGEYEGMAEVHRRSAFLIDPSRTVRLSIGIDAESPNDIDVSPLLEAIREIRTREAE